MSISPFITVFLSSKKREQLTELFLNLDSTVRVPSNVEVLIKVDIEDPELRRWLDVERPRHAYSIRYAVGPRHDGYWTLHLGYAELFKIVNPATYFVHLINDEVRYETDGWDEVLKKYKGLFPDDIFHLRVSRHKFYRHNRFLKAIEQPENYPILTQKWVALAEGFGQFRGPDTWNGGIEWFLANRYRTHRSVPICDVTLVLPNEAVELNADELVALGKRNLRDYAELSSWRSQEHFCYLAAKLFVAIQVEAWGVREYEFSRDRVQKFVSLLRPSDKSGLYSVRYKISFLQYAVERVFDHHLKAVLQKRDNSGPWFQIFGPRRAARIDPWIRRIYWLFVRLTIPDRIVRVTVLIVPAVLSRSVRRGIDSLRYWYSHKYLLG